MIFYEIQMANWSLMNYKRLSISCNITLITSADVTEKIVYKSPAFLKRHSGMFTVLLKYVQILWYGFCCGDILIDIIKMTKLYIDKKI